MQQLPRRPATIQPSSPPVETETRAASEQLLRKVEDKISSQTISSTESAS
jgi:hypothetical protein